MRFNTPTRVLAFTVFAASLVCAQFDSAAFIARLRSNYGPPVNRQTFVSPAGEIVVDYGSNGYVCKLRLPPTAPEDGKAGVRSAAAADKLLLQLLPLALRGKKLGMNVAMFGAPGFRTTLYENLAIAESSTGDERTELAVYFSDKACEK